MNQTRVFLIVAWLMVATLLWMEWGKEKSAPAPAADTSSQTTANPGDGTVPAPAAASAEVPTAAKPAAAPANVAASPASAPVTVSTDVLKLVVNGGGVVQADLLTYPQTKQPGSAPVRLFDGSAKDYYVAQSGWTSAINPAPNHLTGFVPEGTATTLQLAPGQDSLVVPFVWNGPDGVTIRRSYVLKRGQYAIEVRDEVVNAGSKPWQGAEYRQLVRKPPVIGSSMTNPEHYSFNGATWYSPANGYQRRAFKEFLEDGRVDEKTDHGWVAMIQHHFFSAWIPEDKDLQTLSLDAPASGDLIRAVGPAVTVAAGTKVERQARLYVGPKLVADIKAQNVPGLERVVDYSRFSLLALIGQGLFWVLAHVHALIGNWGWAIIGLVVLLRIALYPLSAAQYKSAAKMRKFQPRLQQLKERYGDDRQKFQMATMELYKKEKINPMAGCLPVIPQMIIFMALYWVLVESVELRQAPWLGWIQDLTARDPYFILPVLNIAVMWFTQKLTPTPAGMDPMQAKMMQFMPLMFGVMTAFVPSGLALYWVVNGTLSLAIQWWMIKQHGEHVSLTGKPD